MTMFKKAEMCCSSFLLLLIFTFGCQPRAGFRHTGGEDQLEKKGVERKALIDAVRKNDVESAKRLIAKGISPNSMGDLSPGCINIKSPALSIAVLNGYKDMAAMLLQAGAEADACDSFGKTPLHYAASLKPPIAIDLISILMDHGADIDAQNSTGQAPLHLAVMCGHKMVVSHLLKYQPDIMLKDYLSSLTPLFYSYKFRAGADDKERGERKEIMLMLQDYAKEHPKLKQGHRNPKIIEKVEYIHN